MLTTSEEYPAVFILIHPKKLMKNRKKKLKIKVTRRVREEKYWADTVETSVVELGGTVVVNQLLHLHSRNESWHCYTVFKSSPNSVVSLAENQSKQSLKPSRTNKTITPRSLSIIIDKLTWVKGILVLCCFFVSLLLWWVQSVRTFLYFLKNLSFFPSTMITSYLQFICSTIKAAHILLLFITTDTW